MHTHRQVCAALFGAALLAAPARRAAAQDPCPVLRAAAPLEPAFVTLVPEAFTRAVPAFTCAERHEWRPAAASARLWHQGDVPDARGDGAAITGAGVNLHLRAGVEGRAGRVVFRVAPEFFATQNRAYQTFPGRDTSRSTFASPFYTGAFSADLPGRFGVASFTRIEPGESGIWVTGARWSLGATTALPSWGPGVGEGLVLGRSAPGLPRLEYDREWRPGGHGLRARWFAGVAVESRFFNADPLDQRRQVAGLRLEYAPPAADPLRFGIARTVMDGRRDRNNLTAAFHPLLRTPGDSSIEFLSVDGRYDHAAAGTTAWFEAARQAPLRSLHDLVLMPTEGIALRLGLVQRVARRGGTEWTAAAEFVRLDQPRQREDHPPQDLYTSPTVPHGWTHHGQPLGSGLGPGGQRQYLALERADPRWRITAFVERARWNEDAMFREFLPYPNRHDVTLQGGLRAARADGTLALTVSGGRRFNYLFQNDIFIPGYRTADLPLLQLGLVYAP
jgi:hypothetical protein